MERAFMRPTKNLVVNKIHDTSENFVKISGKIAMYRYIVDQQVHISP